MSDITSFISGTGGPIPVSDATPLPVTFTSPGGGGDASAANQLLEIIATREVRDRLPPTLAGGRMATEVLPTLGGSTRVTVAAAGGASALPSPALSSGLRAVIITAVGTDVRFEVGPSVSVSASATSHFLPMGASRTFMVAAGNTVAAISAGPATGSLEISEVV